MAHDSDGGIGKDGGIPWDIKEDMRFFRQITLGCVLIMGRLTWESLPFQPLPNRHNIILSKDDVLCEGVFVEKSLTKALLRAAFFDSKVFIIGGVGVFYEALFNFNYLCDGVYATEIHDSYDCDRAVDPSLWRGDSYPFEVERHLTMEDGLYDRYFYQFHSCESKYSPEYPYLSLLQHILDDGEERPDRTGVGTKSIFGTRMEFDISKSLPVITTKKVMVKKVIGELLWMISGSTNVEDLQRNGIHFWDANSSREFLDQRGLNYEEGDLGPVYGFQWRHWGADYEGCKVDHKGFDQLQHIVEQIRNEPESRRIILSAWNVGDIGKMALPPCHLLAQFYVRSNEYLDCQLYQRSGDMFLGVPFNIMSYSCLTYMLAHITGLKPGRFVHTLGDSHIYLNHIDQVKVQLSRTPRPFPTLHFRDGLSEIDDFTLDDFIIDGYEPAPFIKAKMAV